MYSFNMLKGLSIKSKMMAIYMIVNLTAMTIVFINLLSFEFYSNQHAIEEHVQIQAKIAEQAIAETMVAATPDTNAIKHALGFFTFSTNIMHADIYDAHGQLLCSYYANSDSQQESQINHPLTSNLTTHVTRYPIHWSKQQVGEMVIYTSLNSMYMHILLFSGIAVMAGLLALLGAYVLEKKLNLSFTEPLLTLNSLINRITHEKNFNIRSQLKSSDEIGTLASGLNNLLEIIQKRDAELATELTNRKLVEKRLDQLAHYDNVSNLPNRHYFNDHLERAILDANKANSLLCVMFIDLDNFKIVNDTLGHLAGDQLLKEAARRIMHTLKPEDVACRIGGDEFAIVLSNLNATSEADPVAQGVISNLNQVFIIQNNEIYVGASIGISFYPSYAHDVSSLLSSADAAMYHAKSLGKNNYQHYHTDMEGKIRRRLNMENSLRRAIEGDELEVYYQPQVDVHTLEIQGFEALIRWNHPKMGMISPTEFIPIAEESGQIRLIGEWVLQTACYQTQQWQKRYGREFKIAVNFSARQLRDEEMVEKILQALLITNLPPHTLDIELTESSLMDQSDTPVAKMRELRSAGIHISIDDFGTGFSSLSYLKRFPLSALKIDRSFINDIPHDEDDVAITNAIIALANTLKIDVIAEGVETIDQLNFLRQSCNGQAQGYLFSPPLTANKMEAFLDHLETPLKISF